MRVRIKLEGFKALADSLRALPEEMRRRVMVRAVRAAARPVEEEAKRLAPVLKKPDPRRKPGTLRNAIRTARMRSQNPDVVAMKVHVRRLAGKAVAAFKSKTGKQSSENPDDPFYARFVEFGTSKMPADPFLRPALLAKRQHAIEAMRAETKAGIEREAKSRARKAK